MTATVEELQRDVPGIIGRARTGEEVLITEGQVPIVKLVSVNTTPPPHDKRAWIDKLRRLQKSMSTGKVGLTTDEILEEDRSEERE